MTKHQTSRWARLSAANPLAASVALGLGAMAGLLLCVALLPLISGSPEEISAARKLGIVSWTILKGYPKGVEWLRYLLALFLIIGMSYSAWMGWAAYTLRRIKGSFDEDRTKTTVGAPDRKESGQARWWEYLIILGLILIITFRAHHLWGNWFNPWAFYGEEGEHLGWIQGILNGQVLYRDTFCLYGPLMEYPLALLQLIFGPHVIVQRAYAYGLDVAAILMLFSLLRRLARSPWTAYGTTFVLIFLYIPWLLTPQTSLMRLALPLFALSSLHRFFHGGRRRHLLTAGALTGAAILFSQEFGIAALAGIFVAGSAQALFEGRPFKRFLADGGVLVAGIGLLWAPMLIFFAAQGALGAFVDNLVNYPRYLTLGYANLPFPNILEHLGQVLSTGSAAAGREFMLTWIQYWPIPLFAGVAIALGAKLSWGRPSKATLTTLAVVVFGIVSFRSSLARSSLETSFKVLPPALLLAALGLEAILRSMKVYRRHVPIMIVLSAGLLFLLSGPLLHGLYPPGMTNIKRLFGADPRSDPRKLVPLTTARAKGILVPPRIAREVGGVLKAIREKTRPGDTILSFPNQPMFYFLGDRRIPYPFVLDYNAVIRAQREEGVRILKKNPPKLIIYDNRRLLFRHDKIHERVQIPEVFSYIKKNFHPIGEVGHELLLLPGKSRKAKANGRTGKTRMPGKDESRTANPNGVKGELRTPLRSGHNR